MPRLNFRQNTVSVVEAVPVLEAGDPFESLCASLAVLLDSLGTISDPTRGFAVNARQGPDVSFPLSTNQLVVGESFQMVIRGAWKALELQGLGATLLLHTICLSSCCYLAVVFILNLIIHSEVAVTEIGKFECIPIW